MGEIRWRCGCKSADLCESPAKACQKVQRLEDEVAALTARLTHGGEALRQSRRECAMNRHLVNVVIQLADYARRHKRPTKVERALMENVCHWVEEYDDVLDDEFRVLRAALASGAGGATEGEGEG